MSVELARAQAILASMAGRSDADAIREIAKIATTAKSQQIGWGRLRLLALRELGRYLIENAAPRGRPRKMSAPQHFSTLPELGISRNLSAEAKSVARIDQRDFDSYLTTEPEPSLAGLLRSVVPLEVSASLETGSSYRTFHSVDATTTTGEFYTPPEIFHALGDPEFDLDVASPGASIVKWIPARRHLTPREDGLATDWQGAFVWAHPVYGVANGVEDWIEKFVANANGIMLLPDFTSAGWWHALITRADTALFVKPKINFLPEHGSHNTMGATLVALGKRGVGALATAEQNGRGVVLRRR
jgi:hypothetical protein